MRNVSLILLLVACGSHPQMGATGGGTAGGGAAGGAASAGGSEAPDSGAPDAGNPEPDAGPPDSGTEPDAGNLLDSDHDGIADVTEAQIASDYLPQLALNPTDHCPLSGIIYRLRPHPQDSTLVLILFDHLYERDCGSFGHTGDNETFAVTVNPLKPAPSGLTAMKAISHQNTPCQKITTCGTCGGITACDLGPSGKPVIYASKDKHGGYVEKSACKLIDLCSEDCAMGDQVLPPLVNVGEPNYHLVGDLTDAGFVTAANGWTKPELFHFDPWGPNEFGTAGKPSGDLVDSSFDPPACH